MKYGYEKEKNFSLFDRKFIQEITRKNSNMFTYG